VRANSTLLTLLATVAVGVLLLVTGGLLVSSTMSQTRAIEAQTGALSIQNVSHGVALSLLQVEVRGLTDLHDELEALRLSLPPNTNLAPFILQLDALALEHQVAVEAMSVSAAQVQPSRQVAAGATAPPTTSSPLPAGTLLGVPISLNVSGRYDGVLAFLNGLQRGQRMLSVTSFNTAQASDGSAAVSGTISAIVYVLTDSVDG
jgi:Tfp pilus assembly protein PilO